MSLRRWKRHRESQKSNRAKLEKQQLVRTAHSFVPFFAVIAQLRRELNK